MMTNGLLLVVLSVVLGQFPGGGSNEREIAFAELPRECAAEYDAALRDERKAAATRVCRLDLDGDGAEELLVWTGESGSGGETWSVMTRRGGRWVRAGRVFGIPHFVDLPPHCGLLVETPCGWEAAAWEFFTLENGALAGRLKLDVRYRKPTGDRLRTRPAEIKIEEPVTERPE